MGLNKLFKDIKWTLQSYILQIFYTSSKCSSVLSDTSHVALHVQQMTASHCLRLLITSPKIIFLTDLFNFSLLCPCCLHGLDFSPPAPKCLQEKSLSFLFTVVTYNLLSLRPVLLCNLSSVSAFFSAKNSYNGYIKSSKFWFPFSLSVFSLVSNPSTCVFSAINIWTVPDLLYFTVQSIIIHDCVSYAEH